MAHELYRQMSGGTPNDGGFSEMAGQVMRFAQNYRGDPYAEAESMIRSGKITREQWNEALNMARQIRPHLQK